MLDMTHIRVICSSCNSTTILRMIQEEGPTIWKEMCSTCHVVLEYRVMEYSKMKEVEG